MAAAAIRPKARLQLHLRVPIPVKTSRVNITYKLNLHKDFRQCFANTITALDHSHHPPTSRRSAGEVGYE